MSAGGGGDDAAARDEDRTAADTIDQLNSHRSPGSGESACADDSQPAAYSRPGSAGAGVHEEQYRQYRDDVCDLRVTDEGMHRTAGYREEEMIYRQYHHQQFQGMFPHEYHQNMQFVYDKEEMKREDGEERYEDILELGEKVGRRNLDVCSNASGRSSEGLEHGTPPVLEYQDNKDGLLDLHLPQREIQSNSFVHLAAALHSPGSAGGTEGAEEGTELYQGGAGGDGALHRLQPYSHQHEVIQHSNNYQPS